MPIKPPEHRPPQWKRATDRELRRITSTKRGYGYKWQCFRLRYLAQHPLCVHCEAQGKVTAATDVDHVIPHRGDMDSFWRGPFQALCHSCHAIKTRAGL